MADQDKGREDVRNDPAPAGGDFDTRLQELKTRRAAAETSGDTGQVADLDDEVKQLRADREQRARGQAAQARREASGDPKAAQSKAPSGRAPASKAQTRA